MKDIIFWIIVAFVGWSGLRHLFAIIIKYDAMGPLKEGQGFTHFISALILLSSSISAILYTSLILPIMGFVIEYLFRQLIIRSGEKNKNIISF